jgi:hypothetical protein
MITAHRPAQKRPRRLGTDEKSSKNMTDGLSTSIFTYPNDLAETHTETPDSTARLPLFPRMWKTLASGFDSAVDPQVADVCFTVLYNIPNDSDLVSTIPLVSDYLCTRHLFREAFELNYTLLDNLVFGSAFGEESFVGL